MMILLCARICHVGYIMKPPLREKIKRN